jgi:DNA-binding transcriptional MerR regulator
MKVKQLSERSGVPLSKIKFYIREGLLASGALSSPNQATYDSSHLERLDLIRVLREVGGLSIGAVQEVLVALDNPDEHADPVEAALMHRPGGQILSDEVEAQPEFQRALLEVREFVQGLDWSISGWGEGYIRIMADAVYGSNTGPIIPSRSLKYMPAQLGKYQRLMHRYRQIRGRYRRKVIL